MTDKQVRLCTRLERLAFAKGNFGRHLQQGFRILAWITIPEHRVARHQNVRTGANDVGDGFATRQAPFRGRNKGDRKRLWHLLYK